jgi:hypothetical protein
MAIKKNIDKTDWSCLIAFLKVYFRYSSPQVGVEKENYEFI